MKEEEQMDVAKGLQGHWETQCQELLENSQPIQQEGRSPTPSEMDPWNDPEAFLASFEQVAKACRWPQEEWVDQLLPALRGRAEEAFGSLEPLDREDYKKVKAAILEAHTLRPQRQSQDYSYFSSQEAEDPQSLHSQLQELWHQWLKPERQSKEHVLEQFLASLPLHLQDWIRVEGQDTRSQAAVLAEEFLMSQKIAQRRKWKKPIKEECLDFPNSEKELLNAGDVQAYKSVEQSSDMLEKESQVKTENEPEDNPRMSIQISQMNALERTDMCEEGCELIEEQEKQLVTKKNICCDLKGGPFLQPSKGDPNKEMVWFSKHSRSYHCTLQLDVFDSREDHNKPTPEKDLQLNSCSKKRDGIIKGKRKSELSENGQGDNLDGPQIHQLEDKSPSSSDGGSGKGPYECFHCQKCFREQEHLVNHERLHIGENTPGCPTSGKVFPLRQTIMRQQGMNTGEKTDKCSQCGKWFSGRENLKRHQRIHTGERRYKCPDCGKSCSQSGHLKLHQRVHTGEKPYKCSWCGKNFADGGNLRKHERIHTGEKPYKCSWCGRCFTDGGTLKQHERIHTGEKPYKCSQCGKCFSERGTLKQHHRIHTGEKPYGCPECDKKFRKKGDLLRHQKVHTQEK